jgi:tetratricopeptide (TPR) repeat protein
METEDLGIHPDKYFDMSMSFFQLGFLKKTQIYLNKALSLYKENNKKALCYNFLGCLFYSQKNSEKAEFYHRKAIELDNSQKVFHINLLKDLSINEEKNIKEIKNIFEKFIYDKSDYQNNIFMSELYFKNCEYEKAYEIYESLLGKTNDLIGLYCKMATIAHIIGNNEKCEDLARKALSIDPNHHHSKIFLGISQLYLKKFNEAKTIFLNLENDQYSKKWYLGYIYFLEKNYKLGWKNYEVRLKTRTFPELLLRKQMWNGENPVDKTILIIGEQGIGDNIMASRWFFNLNKKFKKVLYMGSPNMKNFMATVNADIEVLDYLDENTCFDYWLPIMSLPFYLDLDEKDLCKETPYFNISTNIKIKNKKTIGLSWVGSKEHKNNHYRSIFKKDYGLLKNLINENQNFEWVSLIKDDEEKGYEYLNIPNVFKNVEDLKETADYINNLDLVITIDNLFVHMAGALNKKTFLMIPWFPEWRWGLNEKTCIWYPSVEIFRQEKAFDWNNVISDINIKLKSF